MGRPSNATNPRTRGMVGFILKSTVTLGLIVWLVRSGSLEFGRLGVLVSSAEVLAITALTWLSMSIGLSSLRWVIILRMDGVKIPFVRGAGLQWMALFFNGLVPGNLGGDFLKNHAVFGNQGGRIVVLVLIERVLGVISLIWVAAVGVLFHMDSLVQNVAFRNLALFIGALTFTSVAGPLLFLRLLPDVSTEPLTPLAASTFVGKMKSMMRRQLVAAHRSLLILRGARKEVAVAFAVSFAMHMGNMAYFFYLTRLLGNPHALLADVAMVFPVGMLSVALPVSISGLGVGHVMFNALFAIVGLLQGATIFNVYIVAQLLPAVGGAAFYLFSKNRGKSSDTAVGAPSTEK